MEAEPVVAASVARGAGGVVCEEALAAAFEGGGREARSVVGHLDDEVAALDVAGDRHARARVLGGVGHEVRGGSRQGGSVERGLGWIGNIYLDDSGRDSPASLNSTGDM